MNDHPPLWMRWGGMIAAHGIHAWMSTLDYRGMLFEPSADPVHDVGRTRIYVFWHEYILLPLYLRGNCNLTMLLSKHRDADILMRLAYHLGFECVRGSTYGGATEALLELSRRGRQMHLTITPDGPRGPRRRLAQGPVFLASRMQAPIVPIGFGLDRPWRAGSWDRFAIPKPGSRARGIMGPEIYIPPNLDRQQLELRRVGVERLLNELTTEAECWAAAGDHRLGDKPFRREGCLHSNRPEKGGDVPLASSPVGIGGGHDLENRCRVA